MPFKSKVGSFDSDFVEDIELIPLIFGIFFIILGLVDMIVLYVIPNQKIKENKKKFPNYTFAKPQISIIAIHFTLHSLVILFGVFLILFSFRPIIGSNSFEIFGIISLIVTGVLIFAFWITEICLGLTKTRESKSNETIDSIKSILSNPSPANLIFIYSKDTVSYKSCKYVSKKKKNVCKTKQATCYSNSGVSIPITSNLTKYPLSNFSEPSDLFGINLRQKPSMSLELKNNYNDIMILINGCNKYHKVIEYYPLVSGYYIVSDKKIPTALSKSSRLASIILGVGVYYELMSKSIPIINYEQTFYADVVSSYDYNSIWKGGSCSKYGGCNRRNSKPNP